MSLRESKFDGEGTETKLWRFADERANKIGPHHTVFWCKRDPKWVEAKRLGLPTKQVRFGHATDDMGMCVGDYTSDTSAITACFSVRYPWA